MIASNSFRFELVRSQQLSMQVMHMLLIDISASNLQPDKIVIHHIEVLFLPLCWNIGARVS